MSNIDDVRSAFATGALEISKRMSDQINNSVNYPNAGRRVQAQ